MAKQRTQWGGIIEGEIVNFRYKGKKKDAKSRNRTCLILNMRHMYLRNDGKKVRFILVENFNANGNDCKKVKFNEPLKLSSNDQGTDVSLDICKINNNYEISSINLSK